MAIGVLLAAVVLVDGQLPGPEFDHWGFESLDTVAERLYLEDSRLYADRSEAGNGPSGPAFMWGCGVMLSALNGAAATDPERLPDLTSYIHALEQYWNSEGPVPGLDVLPTPKPVDRYYDDNAWIVIALTESYRILTAAGDESEAASALAFAERTMEYVLSGEDDVLDGGIYWRESDKASKNTCSNSPSAVAAYLLFEITGIDEYRAAGERLLKWALEHLQDPADGLMWDNLSLDGTIEKTKWSYNTALTIRALLLAAENASMIAPRFLLESAAVHMTEAAMKQWIDPETGALKDGAAFAHLLVEALFEVSDRTGNDEYSQAALSALDWLHSHAADARGVYPAAWDSETVEPLDEWTLMDQAAAARGFLVAHLYTSRSADAESP